jgi:hypothetical protein
MATSNNWTQDYGGNLISPKNELAILYYQPVGDSAAKLSGGVTSGKRYIFIVKDPGLANTFISVMELSSAPVAITGVSRHAGKGLITINLNGTPSAEEKVYVRYKDGAWKYSQVIQATVTENSATATIPDIKNGKNDAWYVFTSTSAPEKIPQQLRHGCADDKGIAALRCDFGQGLVWPRELGTLHQPRDQKPQ